GQRQHGNLEFGRQLLQEGYLKPARVFLERAWSQSDYQDTQALSGLIRVHESAADFKSLTQDFKKQGFAAARRGDFETMLQAFYNAYYGAYVRTASYQWQELDQAIDTTLCLVAGKVTPLAAHEELAQALPADRLKIVFALDSLDPRWVTVRRFVEVAKRMDKNIFSVLVLAFRQAEASWQPVIASLAENGCHTVWAPGDKLFPRVQQSLYLLRRIGCDYLVMNTPFTTPHIDLLAHCRPARWNIKFVSQGGGLETSVDRAWTTVHELLIDEVSQGFFIGPAFVDQPTQRPAPRPRRPGELRVACVGRVTKFAHNERFWQILLRALSRLPGLSVDIIGCNAEELFAGGSVPHPRLRFLGFRNDVPRLLPEYDVLLDTWPRGGGSTIREALGVGVPVVSVRAQLYEHYDSRAALHVGCNEMVHPDLLLPEMNSANLLGVLKRLGDDLAYYQGVVDHLAKLDVFGPQEVAVALQNHLLGLGQ
ncbi:MAG: glycosyltransferase, partial [Desulfarculus sp.]|nr:glycosyltransferase [Desulfarculus sp.]